MSQDTPGRWLSPYDQAMLAAIRQTAADPVLSELAALRADVAALKAHLMAPQTSLVIGAEVVAAFRRLQEGGAA